jgi:hypothetical protein
LHSGIKIVGYGIEPKIVSILNLVKFLSFWVVLHIGTKLEVMELILGNGPI